MRLRKTLGVAMLSLPRMLSGCYWGRHRARLVLLVGSIALGVAAWTATTILSDNLERTSRSAAVPLAGAADLFVSQGDANVPAQLANELAQIPGVRRVRSVVIHRGQLPGVDLPVLLLGLDLPQEPDGSDNQSIVIETPQTSVMRDILLGRQPALVGQALAEHLPDRFELLVGGRSQRLSRIGTITQVPSSFAILTGYVVVLPSASASAMLGHPEKVNRLDVRVEPGSELADVKSRIEARLAGRAEVQPFQSYDERSREVLVGVKLGLRLCSSAVLIAALFLIYHALAVSVTERGKDIGILRCLGATRYQILAWILTEALCMGLAGSLAGFPIGLGLAHLSLGPMQHIVSDLFLPVDRGMVQFTIGNIFEAGLAGGLTSVLAGLLPALEAVRQSPLACAKQLGEGPIRRRWRLATCLALVVGGLVGLSFKEQLPARLGSVGALTFWLMAVVLMVPLAAAGAARLFATLASGRLGVAWQLAAANVMHSSGRTGLVIAVQAVSVALLLFTAGLIHSNEQAVQQWVDQSIAGDLFVTSGGPLCASGRTLPMDERVRDALHQALPSAEWVAMRFRHLDWQHRGRQGRILILALDADRYYRANADRQPPLRDLERYRQLCEPGTALISENFASLYGVRTGDHITLPSACGPLDVEVRGTVADYSCPQGVVMVDRCQFLEPLNANLVDVFDVYLPAGTDAEQARQQLQRTTLAASLSLCIVSKTELRQNILGMVERLYGLAYLQEIIVGIVALLGIVSALMIAVLLRRREFGLLRAIGGTKRQVLASVLAEALLMALIGAGIGILIGAPLTWYSIRVILFEESGFLFPYQFPWQNAGCLLLGAAIGAVLVGFWPAFMAIRPGISESVVSE